LKYDNIPIEELKELGIVKNSEEENCFVCGEKTVWFDTYFKTPSCRQKCSRMMSKVILNEVKRLNDTVTRLENRINRLMR
jgi:hypothetical protein